MRLTEDRYPGLDRMRVTLLDLRSHESEVMA